MLLIRTPGYADGFNRDLGGKSVGEPGIQCLDQDIPFPLDGIAVCMPAVTVEGSHPLAVDIELAVKVIGGVSNLDDGSDREFLLINVCDSVPGNAPLLDMLCGHFYKAAVIARKCGVCCSVRIDSNCHGLRCAGIAVAGRRRSVRHIGCHNISTGRQGVFPGLQLVGGSVARTGIGYRESRGQRRGIGQPGGSMRDIQRSGVLGIEAGKLGGHNAVFMHVDRNRIRCEAVGVSEGRTAVGYSCGYGIPSRRYGIGTCRHTGRGDRADVGIGRCKTCRQFRRGRNPGSDMRYVQDTFLRFRRGFLPVADKLKGDRFIVIMGSIIRPVLFYCCFGPGRRVGDDHLSVREINFLRGRLFLFGCLVVLTDDILAVHGQSRFFGEIIQFPFIAVSIPPVRGHTRERACPVLRGFVRTHGQHFLNGRIKDRIAVHGQVFLIVRPGSQVCHRFAVICFLPFRVIQFEGRHSICRDRRAVRPELFHFQAGMARVDINVIDVELNNTVLLFHIVQRLERADNLGNSSVHRIIHGVDLAQMARIRIGFLVIILVAAAYVFGRDVGFLVFPGVSRCVHKGLRDGAFIFRHVIHAGFDGIVIHDCHAVRPDCDILGVVFCVAGRNKFRSVLVDVDLRHNIGIGDQAVCVLGCVSVDVHAVDDLLCRMDQHSVFIHDLLCHFQRHNACAGCFGISAQDKVHAASVYDAAALPQVIVPADRRTFIELVIVGEAGRHIHVHVQGQRLIGAVSHLFIQLAPVRIHHVEVFVLDRRDHIGDLVVQPFTLHAVGVGILPPVIGRTDFRHLEPAFNADLHGADIVMGVGGIACDDKRVIQLVVILIVRLDRGVFHVFGINGYFGAQIQRRVRSDVIFNHRARIRIPVIICTVRQGYINPGFTGDGDVDMVYGMVPGDGIPDLRRIREQDLHTVVRRLLPHQADRHSVAVQFHTQVIAAVPGLCVHLLAVIVHVGAAFGVRRPVDGVGIIDISFIVPPGLVGMRIESNISAVFLGQGVGLARIQVTPVIVGRQLIGSISGRFRPEVDMPVRIGSVNRPQHGVVHCHTVGHRVIIDGRQGGVIVDDIVISVIFRQNHVFLAVFHNGIGKLQVKKVIAGASLVPSGKPGSGVKLVQPVGITADACGDQVFPVTVPCNPESLGRTAHSSVGAAWVTAVQIHIQLVSLGVRCKDIIDARGVCRFESPDRGFVRVSCFMELVCGAQINRTRHILAVVAHGEPSAVQVPQVVLGCAGGHGDHTVYREGISLELNTGFCTDICGKDIRLRFREVNHKQFICPFLRSVRQADLHGNIAVRLDLLSAGPDLDIKEPSVLVFINVYGLIAGNPVRLLKGCPHGLPQVFRVLRITGLQLRHRQFRVRRDLRVRSVGHADLIGISVRGQNLLCDLFPLHHAEHGEAVRGKGYRVDRFAVPFRAVLIRIRFGFNDDRLVIFNMNCLDVVLFRQFDDIPEEDLYIHIRLRFHFLPAADESDVKIPLQGDLAPLLTQRFLGHAAVKSIFRCARPDLPNLHFRIFREARVRTVGSGHSIIVC